MYTFSTTHQCSACHGRKCCHQFSSSFCSGGGRACCRLRSFADSTSTAVRTTSSALSTPVPSTLKMKSLCTGDTHESQQPCVEPHAMMFRNALSSSVHVGAIFCTAWCLPNALYIDAQQSERHPLARQPRRTYIGLLDGNEVWMMELLCHLLILTIVHICFWLSDIHLRSASAQ